MRFKSKIQCGGRINTMRFVSVFPAIESGFRKAKFATKQPLPLYERVSGSTEFCALPVNEFGQTGWLRRVRRIDFQRVEAGALDPFAVLCAWLRRKFFGGNSLVGTPLQIEK